MKFKRWAKAVLIAGAIMAVILPLRIQAAEDPKAIDDYNFAAWLYNSGKYAMATESYQNFLKNHADHAKAPDARFGLAQSFFHQDNFKDAAEQYEAVRAQCPNFIQMPEVLFQLGQARIGLNQFADAQKLFADLRSRFPDHYLADWALAREGACLISLGKPKDAEPLLQTFLGKYTAPGKPSAKVAATGEMLGRLDKAGIKAGNAFLDLVERSAFYVALAQFNQENFVAAQKSFQAFLDQYPDSKLQAEAKFRQAQSLYRQGAFGEAAAAYKPVAEGKSDFADAAAFERGLALHKAGKLKDAAAAFAEMAECFPGSARSPKARLYSGTLLFDAGDYDGAMARLKPMADAKKELADEAAYWIGMSLLKSGRSADAELRFTEAMQAFPKSALSGDIQLGLADARLALNKHAAAAEAFQKYAHNSRQAEQAPRALYSAAVALHRAEKYAPADAVCTEFLTAYARNDLAPQVMFLSAENRFLQKDYNQAAAQYKDFLDRKDAPADLASRAHFRLAWIQRYAKRYDAALEELAKVDGAVAGKTVAGEVGYLKGVCFFELKKYPEAVQSFTAYLQSGDTGRFGDDALLKLAIAQSKQNQPKAAMEAFARLLREYPKSELLSQAQYQLAECCYDLKQYGQAIENYRKVADRQPPDELSPYAMFGMAMCQYDQGAWAAAAQSFGQVADKFKNADLIPQALYRKGTSLMKLTKWAEAETVFRALLIAYPKHELARASLVMAGTCLQEQKKWAEAAKAFQSVIADFAPDKDQSRMFYELGWSWREAGKDAESLAAFRALADKFPGDPLAVDALFYLAEAKYKEPVPPEPPGETTTRLDAAREMYAKVLALSKDKRLGDKSIYRIGWCYWLTRKYKEAAVEFDKLCQDFGGSELVPDALFQAGQSYAKAGEPELASKRFEELVKNSKYAGFKYLPEANLGLGEAKLALNQPAEAVQIFVVWLAKNEKHPSAAQAHFLIGRAKYDLKEYDAALESFGNVPALTRSDLAAQAQFYIGQVLQARGDFKGASLAYLRVQALYPDAREWVAAAMFESGKCCEALGNKEEAHKFYREVAEKYKGTQWAELAAGRLK
ncbi:MAG: tetratricopeptide repeat protein [Kiritimatiellota bacterium]|nr:tetratricopeptide repeat protein [Kiritimatiellota bacterium]